MLLALLLAGSFQAGREADELVIASLVPSPSPADDVQRRLAELAQQPDPPVLRIGGLWTLTAPYDAWSRLGRYVTRGDLGRFWDACLTVLGERDPSLDLPPGERWLAGVRDKLPRHSAYLREGLARSLVLLAKVGDAAEVASEPSPAAWAERIVGDLLGREPDADRWRSLSGVLGQLAAAAPDLFLGRLEASLAHPDRAVMALFVEEGGLGGPGGRHPRLLWALESLAWDPRRLGRVALALGRLAALDPGGRLGNRPAGSLRALFLPWLPQTEADLPTRLAAIDGLLAREPEAGLGLLVDLLPGQVDRARHTAGPGWDDRPVTRERASPDEGPACTEAVLDRLVPRLADHPAYWSRSVARPSARGAVPEVSGIRARPRRPVGPGREVLAGRPAPRSGGAARPARGGARRRPHRESGAAGAAPGGAPRRPGRLVERGERRRGGPAVSEGRDGFRRPGLLPRRA